MIALDDACVGEYDRPGKLRMTGQFYASPYAEHRPVFTCTSARHERNVFGCGDEEGNVSLINAATGESMHVAQPDSIFDLQFSLDDRQILLSSADEFAYIRDAERLGANPLMCFGYHQGTVRTARWHPSNPSVLVTAARDGDMAVWDTRTASASPSSSVPVAVYSEIHKGVVPTRRGTKGHEKRTVVQAEFLPGQDHIIATIGQPDYAIKFWDWRYKWGPGTAPVPIDQIRLSQSTVTRERAFTNFIPSPDGSALFAANANSSIYKFSLASFSSRPLQTFRAEGFQSGSFFVKLALSPCGDYIASGSTQDRAYIWSTRSSASSQGSFRIGGHFREVTSVAWTRGGSSGDLGLLTCGEDGAINCWSEEPVREELLGFGRPVFQKSEVPTRKARTALYSSEGSRSSFIHELSNLPSHQTPIEPDSKENMRPRTPPNAIEPSLQGSSKKISDYFRPAQHGLSLTEQLMQSHRTTPYSSKTSSASSSSVAIESGEGKRHPSRLSFCSSPLRPTKKQNKLQ